jgi:hypothetical protein
MKPRRATRDSIQHRGAPTSPRESNTMEQRWLTQIENDAIVGMSLAFGHSSGAGTRVLPAKHLCARHRGMVQNDLEERE